jgi:aquaporin TIP
MSGNPSLAQRALAEFLGTFLFVAVGAGSAVAFQSLGAPGGSSLVVAGLANGIGLGVAISATMGISGGHLNPAVTVGLLVGKKARGSDVLPYIVAQVLGATFACFLLVSTLPQNLGSAVHWGAPAIAGVSVAQGALLEAAMTFFLVFTVYGTIVDARAPKIAGFGVGLFVLAAVLAIGPFTGAAMNPARATGPMVAGLFFPGYWYLYWAGPLAGGIIAGAVQRFIERKQE